MVVGSCGGITARDAEKVTRHSWRMRIPWGNDKVSKKEVKANEAGHVQDGWATTGCGSMRTLRTVKERLIKNSTDLTIGVV